VTAPARSSGKVRLQGRYGVGSEAGKMVGRGLQEYEAEERR